MSHPTALLGEIAEVAAGGGAPQNADSFTAEGTPFIRAGSLNPLVNGASESTLEHLTDEVAKEHGLRKFPRDTVVFAKSGMSATKGHVYRLRNEAYVVNHLAAIIPTQRVVPEFLEHSLRVFSPVRLIQDAAYPSVRLSDVATMKIPLPPLAEQRRIAEVLDRAEALRAKRRAALAQLDALTQSLFLDLFGDPATNPKRWPVRRLIELIIDGPQNGLYKPSTDYGSGTPILRIDAFYDGAVTDISALKRVRLAEDERNKFRLTEDDVVINRVNSLEYLGKCALIPKLPEKAVFESNMMRMRFDPKTTQPRFVVQFLQTGFVKSQIQMCAKHAVNQASINQQDVSGFRVNLPPLPLQREFTRRVTAVESLKTAQRAALAELDALFATLQHRAFRGEL